MNGTVTCPDCGHEQQLTIPKDSCKFFYHCNGCDTRIKAEDTCCVFCAYGDIDCPMERDACAES